MLKVAATFVCRSQSWRIIRAWCDKSQSRHAGGAGRGHRGLRQPRGIFGAPQSTPGFDSQ